MPSNDEFLFVADADVVEWPRLSQQVRLERKQATHSYHVMDWNPILTMINYSEVAVFYSLDAAIRFCKRYKYSQVEQRQILRQF